MPDNKIYGAILENIKNIADELKNVRDDIRHIDKKMDITSQRVTKAEVKIEQIADMRNEFKATEDIIFREFREWQKIRESDLRDAEKKCRITSQAMRGEIEKDISFKIKNSILSLQVLVLTSLVFAIGSIVFEVIKFYFLK